MGQLSREDKIKKYKIPRERPSPTVLMSNDSYCGAVEFIEQIKRLYEKNPSGVISLESWTENDYGDISSVAELRFKGSVPYTDAEIDQLIQNHEKYLEYQAKEKERRLKEKDKIWQQLCKERGIELDENGKVVPQT